MAATMKMLIFGFGDLAVSDDEEAEQEPLAD